jgi:UDP-N-acetylmuramoyl-L-alanyl-D-glutamate--2,6-diaminopimelate ligase
VANVRAVMAPAAATFYGDPTATLQVDGVTGTNGKTTTAFLIRALLEAAGRRTGLLGTVKSIVGGKERDVERTTPEAIDLQRTFRPMLDAGDQACAIEVSSHALELHRADAVHLAAAIFTNLTQITSIPTRRWRTTSTPRSGCSLTPRPGLRSSMWTIATAFGSLTRSAGPHP